MALIETGLAGGKDEALAAGGSVPFGTYRAQYMGLLKDKETNLPYRINDKSGYRTYSASFKVVEHPDPLINGKRLPIYRATAGFFTFSDFCDALPLRWEGSQFDDEPAIGTVVAAKVTPQPEKYSDGSPNPYAGEPQVSKISKLK